MTRAPVWRRNPVAGVFTEAKRHGGDFRWHALRRVRLWRWLRGR